MYTQKYIEQAIRDLGARVVYGATIKQMEGADALVSLGLHPPKNMGDVYRLQSAAYEQLGEADKVVDYAQTNAKLDSICNSRKKNGK